LFVFAFKLSSENLQLNEDAFFYQGIRNGVAQEAETKINMYIHIYKYIHIYMCVNTSSFLSKHSTALQKPPIIHVDVGNPSFHSL
jgi:hypothetical protein